MIPMFTTKDNLFVSRLVVFSKTFASKTDGVSYYLPSCGTRL